MPSHNSRTVAWGMWALVAALNAGARTLDAADDQTIALVVKAGRPLRVALDSRVKPKQVGQPVNATVVEPVYAYDRIVVPLGTKVIGHIERLGGVPKTARSAEC